MTGAPGAAPRRVLVLSADIGGGHHATGRALEAAVHERWPEADVEWVDTLDVMRSGPAFRSIYRANVEVTPWLYDFFYDRIDRYRWFARSSKWVTSVWAGLLLRPVLDRLRPDLVLSTYPLGSGGLAWLRRHGRLPMPAGAWISDFAPHPFWVHAPLDLHVVMHPACVPLALRAEPGARVTGPAALPVVPVFADGDREAARRALGLAEDRVTVLVSCGVYGFGAVEEAVDVLLAAGKGRVQVVVATGRNEALRRRLAPRAAAGELEVLGWTDRMPEHTRAADVVVTNAGGATALEALACHRPVLMFRPIAGHGIANARAMAASGVAVLCEDGDALAAALRRLLDEPGARERLEAATAGCTTGGSLADDVERLWTGGVTRPADDDRPLPLTAEDSFWAHLDGERVPQKVAAVALFRTEGPPVDAAAVHDALAATVPQRPWLTWRLERPRWRRPRWVRRDPPERLPVRPARLDGADADRAFDAFVPRPLPAGDPAWEVQVADDWPGGVSAMLIRASHAFGDGFAVLDAFAGICTRRPVPAGAAAGAAAASAPVVAPAGGDRGPRRTPRETLAAARAVTRGLVSLARSGAAPATPLSARRSGSEPARHVRLTLPDAAARRAARTAGVGTSDLLVGMVAEAVARFLAERGTPSPSGTVRAMVPRTLRVGGGRGPGNRTSAVRVDLPVGPMPAAERVRAVRDVVARGLAADQPAGASAVLGVAARLPAPLHAAAARWLYRSAWFDLIVSVIPGPRTPRWFGPARVERAWAVLPLAEGVGLAVGILAWDDVLAVAVTWDPVLLPDGERLAALLRPVFDELAGQES